MVPAELTIEQLAAQSGMSVRNIRAHQARGLLALPEVRLRVGYYGPEHVTRLRLIRDLQEEGFNLAGIKRLLDDRQGTAERLARFRRAITEPPHAEQPEIITAVALGERFGLAAGDAARVLGRAQRLGILKAAGPDTFEAPSPSLLSVAELNERMALLREEIERSLALGLSAAPSVVDRSISTFVRGELPHFAGETGTFLKCPFLEDVHEVKDAEVAIFGAMKAYDTQQSVAWVRRQRELGADKTPDE